MNQNLIIKSASQRDEFWIMCGRLWQFGISFLLTDGPIDLPGVLGAEVIRLAGHRTLDVIVSNRFFKRWVLTLRMDVNPNMFIFEYFFIPKTMAKVWFDLFDWWLLLLSSNLV